MRTQALFVAAVPAFAWAVTHLQFVLTVLAVAALARVALAVARRYARSVRWPTALAE